MEEIELHMPGTYLEKFIDLDITLPSTTSWRNDNYYRLVELHRSISFVGGISHITSESTKELDKLLIYQEKTCVPLRDPNIFNEDTFTPLWQLTDLGTALELISNPDFKANEYQWKDNEEIRRVFTLTYDVLRFRKVLKEVLEEMDFFENYPQKMFWFSVSEIQLRNYEINVWLILFDFHSRKYKSRGAFGKKEIYYLKNKSLLEADQIVWDQKVPLAASFARVRIKNKAKTMEDLLPTRLRSRMVHFRSSTLVTGFVNIFKADFQTISKMLLAKLNANEVDGRNWHLEFGTCCKDHIVPLILNCCPMNRGEILNSDLVKLYNFILLDRSTCLGAVTLSRAVEQLALTGHIIQTHLIAPPASAYLASLLSLNPNIKKLLIFGTHDKKNTYQSYFTEIGAHNVEVHSEDFLKISTDNSMLCDVVAVLATPPSSNTSVLEPVELAISRNADVHLLHELTNENDISIPPENISSTQKNCLIRAMTIPQIQIIVYETFSNLKEENEMLVSNLVQLMNQYAADKRHDLNVSSPGPATVSAVVTEGENQETEVEEEMETQPTDILVQVPMCDLFQIIKPSDFCPEGKNCLDLKDEGVYLTIIQRKEITRIDSKYMIKMAEERGLFGKSSEAGKVKIQKKQLLRSRSSSLKDKLSIKPKFELERLGAPTLASIRRNIKLTSGQTAECQRFCTHMRQHNLPRLPILARSWWKIVIKHVRTFMQTNKKSKLRIVRLKPSFTKRINLPLHQKILTLNGCS